MGFGDTLIMRDHRLPVLRTIALVVIAAWGSAGYAAGLGPIRVQSALGHPLRASIPIVGANTPNFAADCIEARLEHPDGLLIMAVQTSLASGNQAANIRLSTHQPVSEPAVILNLSVTCGASIQRNYQLLLDPVVILPQTSQADGTDSSRRRNANGEQAMLAPAEGVGRNAVPQRRATPVRTRDNSDAVAMAGMAPALGERKAASAQQDSRKVMRNVLKLSSDDAAVDRGTVFAPALKLSDTLSESRDTGDAQKAAELKSAYARFAMVMRDEDPVASGEKQLKDAQAKLRELEQQVAQAKSQGEQQHQADKAALASLQRDTVSSGWAVFLGVLLATALATIGWLYWRLKGADRKTGTTFWEGAGNDHATESNEWGNTLGVDDTFTATATANPEPADTTPSDWERGVPLDDTLAVDWASRQATLQAPIRQTLTAARARRQQEFAEQDFSVTDSPLSDDARKAFEPEAARILSPASPANPLADEVKNEGFAHAKPVSGMRNSGNDGMQPMKVEEISDLMQEAEFWMLLNDLERAIEILEPYSSVDRPASPVPWIYLLDLYHVTGKRAHYESLAARIKTVFNTSAPGWGDDDTALPTHSLRDYPHVVAMIEELWEGDEVVPYLESLLLDEREGARAGFDLAVYREIIHLIGVARDSKTPKRRKQLRFDAPQPRLISQTLSMQPIKTDKSAPSISDEESEFFDRATSQLATARQVSTKSAVPKAVAPTSAPAVESQAISPGLQRAPEMSAPSTPLRQEAMVEVKVEARAEVSAVDKDQVEIDVVAASLEVAERAVQENVKPDAISAEELERTADMARKLDLVEAYQEIGENVGARVLLEEVIQGGTPLQVEKAKAMLKRLLKEIDWQ